MHFQMKMAALCSTRWNLTHYTCINRDLESDTLHLYLQALKSAHRAVEFYTQVLPTHMYPAHVTDRERSGEGSAVEPQHAGPTRLCNLYLILFFWQMFCLGFCISTFYYWLGSIVVYLIPLSRLTWNTEPESRCHIWANAFSVSFIVLCALDVEGKSASPAESTRNRQIWADRGPSPGFVQTSKLKK